MQLFLFKFLSFFNQKSSCYCLYIIICNQVYAQKETCSEELTVERLVSKGLLKVVLQSPEQSNRNVSEYNPKLQLVWGSTMYHMDDLPFDATNLPDVYTQFRKACQFSLYD